MSTAAAIRVRLGIGVVMDLCICTSVGFLTHRSNWIPASSLGSYGMVTGLKRVLLLAPALLVA